MGPFSFFDADAYIQWLSQAIANSLSRRGIGRANRLVACICIGIAGIVSGIALIISIKYQEKVQILFFLVALFLGTGIMGIWLPVINSVYFFGREEIAPDEAEKANKKNQIIRKCEYIFALITILVLFWYRRMDMFAIAIATVFLLNILATYFVACGNYKQPTNKFLALNKCAKPETTEG